MKKVLLPLVIVNSIALIAIFVIYFSQKPKIGYVDSDKLLNGYQAMTDARNVYQKTVDTWQANLDTLKNDIDFSITKYNLDSASMGKDERMKTKTLIRQKQQQYFNYKEAMEQKSLQEDERLAQNVLEQADRFLRRYGKEKGYDLVFTSAGGATLIYATEGVDITDDVLHGLNEAYKTGVDLTSDSTKTTKE